MTVLLITNDFPPMLGGEAAYYARICATVGDRVAVLAPHWPGHRAFDVRQPYHVIRRWAPVSPHPVARLLQIVMLLVAALQITHRRRMTALHLGHLYLGVIGLVLGRLRGLPYVLYLHGGEMARYMRSRAVGVVVRAVIRRAHRVVVNSTFTRDQYERFGLDPARMTLLPMGVEVNRFAPSLDAREIRAKYGLDGHRLVLTVGRLVERKGHDVVIQALGRIPASVGSVQYLIAGRGPEEARLRRLARSLGSEDDVRFLGHVPDADLPYLYAACDVFAMPSRVLDQRDGIEGFGIAYIEAGACGKPVVAGRGGGTADAVIDGKTGVLVDPLDVGAVASVLTRLLTDPGEAARLGASARHHAEALAVAWPEAVNRLWQVLPGR